MQGPTIRTAALAWVVFAVTLITGTPSHADQDIAREQLPKSWKLESELTDVFFIDANQGWAVGAQGVILKTSDSGETWAEISHVPEFVDNGMSLNQKIRNMRSGIRTKSTGIANGRNSAEPYSCRFESVFFVDPKNGWVAGGYEVPYVGRSRAVMMRTRDGGVTWQSVGNLVVPRFNRIHFTSPSHGWAIGESGNLFQSGIVFTSDGGQSWSSQQNSDDVDPQAGAADWLDAEPTKHGFVTVDYNGKLGVLRQTVSEHSVVLDNPGALVSSIKMVDDQLGFAVGENGTFLKTENSGLSWRNVLDSHATDLVSKFDFRTITDTPAKLWFAGNPGSLLFCYHKTTGETTAQRTPITTRLNRVFFADENHGWAVGEFGSIIATQNGGQDWDLQRGENQRAAIVCVGPDAQSLPLEILSKYAAEENRICASMVLAGSGPTNQLAIQATERLGSVSTTFLNQQHISDSDETAEQHYQRVLEKAVRSLRTLRPNVLVCNSGHIFTSSSDSPLANPITLLKEAIRLANDDSAFPIQLEQMNLKPWKVDRLAILDPTGTVDLDPSRLLPRMGMLLEDHIAVSRGLLGLPVSSPHARKYRVTHFTNRNRMSSGDLLSGLDPRNDAPSRAGDTFRRGNLTMIQNANAKHKKFEQFSKFELRKPQDLTIWRQQVQSFALTMDKDVAGVWLMQLTERYIQDGKTELAANTASLSVALWPEHAFAPASLTWLAQYYASDEFGQIEFLERLKSGQLQRSGELADSEKQRTKFSSNAQVIQHNGASHLVWLPSQAMLERENDKQASEFQPTDAQALNEPAEDTATKPTPEPILNRPALFDDRLRLASRFLSQLGQRDPELSASPQYKLLEAQITRRLDGKLANENRLKSLITNRNLGGAGISIGAQRELSLRGFDPSNASPVGILNCPLAAERPKLDGHLDDACWQSLADAGNLIEQRILTPDPSSSLNAPPDTIAMTYDDEYLYIGVVCQKIKGQYYTYRKSARPRDAELERRDRFEIAIDVDRDYRSVNRFTIDHRGWVKESCTGSLGWNPDWYVSQSETDTTWTAEIAIPLDQIVPGKIEPGSTWAIQVARRAFQPQNLWASSPEVAQQVTKTGFLAGMESRPIDFELIRFTGQHATPAAESQTSTSTPSVSEATRRDATFTRQK